MWPPLPLGKRRRKSRFASSLYMVRGVSKGVALTVAYNIWQGVPGPSGEGGSLAQLNPLATRWQHSDNLQRAEGLHEELSQVRIGQQPAMEVQRRLRERGHEEEGQALVRGSERVSPWPLLNPFVWEGFAVLPVEQLAVRHLCSPMKIDCCPSRLGNTATPLCRMWVQKLWLVFLAESGKRCGGAGRQDCNGARLPAADGGQQKGRGRARLSASLHP